MFSNGRAPLFGLICGLVLCVLQSVAESQTWHHVPRDYPTIQEAVNDCSDFDYILISPGVYSGPGNRDVIVDGIRNLVIRGDGEPEDVIIDAEGSSSENHRILEVFAYNGEHIFLHNLTFRNGYVRKQDGGAVLATYSDVRVENCIFINNKAVSGSAGGFGGGLSALRGSCQIESSLFIENESGFGGAIYSGDIEVSNSSFERNTCAAGGGGVGFENSGNFFDCRFIENSSNVDGGAIHVDYSGFQVLFEDCEFIRNRAARFGGVFSNCFSYMISMNRCKFIENSAPAGGAISINGAPELNITNSLFAGNTASAWGGAIEILVSFWGNFSSCTFTNNYGNEGGALYVCTTMDLSIEDCILYGNDASKGEEIYLKESVYPNFPTVVRIQYSDIEIDSVHVDEEYCQYEVGEGVFDAPPDFKDPENLRFDLNPASPCIDMGNPESASEADICGNPRIVGTRSDIGAYEYQIFYPPGGHILMTDRDMKPGDEFRADFLAVADVEMVEASAVILMEIGRAYFFYPDWTLKYSITPLDLTCGRDGISLFEFTWPAGTGSGHVVTFLGAIFDSTGTLIGDISRAVWGY